MSSHWIASMVFQFLLVAAAQLSGFFWRSESAQGDGSRLGQSRLDRQARRFWRNAFFVLFAAYLGAIGMIGGMSEVADFLLRPFVNLWDFFFFFAN